MIALKNRGVIPAACGECGWSNDGRLVIVDRYATDHPPIPYRGPIIEAYRDDGCDPDDRLNECERCEAPLDEQSCVERY